MSVAEVPQKNLTLDDVDDPIRYEIVDGVLVEMEPMSVKSRAVVGRFARILGNYGETSDLGQGLPEMLIKLPIRRDRNRRPDIVFVSYREWPKDRALTDDNAWAVRPDPFSSYRAGFEIRTYRLCQRVLLFHRFSELGTEPCLVASTDFAYDENFVLTKLIAATQAGYMRDAVTGTYTKKTRPSVDLGYTSGEVHKQIATLDAASFRELPAGVDWRRSQWVDLDGEGLPGLLSDQDGAFYYKHNLGEGRFAPSRRLSARPTLAAGGGVQEITDVDGDGRKELVEFRWPSSGFHERTEGDGWGAFRTFPSQPTIDTGDPNVRFIDLSGDGHDDILMTTAKGTMYSPSPS